MTKVILNLIIQILLFLLTVQRVRAAVMINEVLPNPLSGSSEWVELYNPDNQAVDLVGWKLEDQLSAPSTIFTFTNQVIGAGQYLVAQLPSAKLNNDQDGVTLKDQTGQTIDMMSYVSSTNNKSWARLLAGMAREDGGDFTVATPSPGEQNFSDLTPAPSPTTEPSPAAAGPSPTPSDNSSPLPSPSSTPTLTPSPVPSPIASPSPAPFAASNLQLSEIYACPNTGENEWIEVYNLSNQSGSLTNWKIRDDSDNTRTITVNISAHNIAIIEWNSSLLNNDGDSVTLEDPLGNRAFTVSFNECTKGQSFIYQNNTWQLTTTPTKNTSNIYTNSTSSSPSPSPSVSPSPAASADVSSDNLTTADGNQLDTNGNYADSLGDLDPDSELALPDLEIQSMAAADSGEVLGATTDSTPSAQLVAPPPSKTGVISLLGSSAAMIGGSCWTMFNNQKRKDDSPP